MADLTKKNARTGQVVHGGDELSQYLTFSVGSKRLAIGILDVKEIIEVSALTRVPMTLQSIRGVINLRGNVVPVVDLTARLDQGRSDTSKRSCIVLVEMAADDNEEKQTVGMLVDKVNEILEIPETHMQPAPEFGADIRTDFIERIGRVDDGFIILLDIDRVLSAEELSRNMDIVQRDPESPAKEAAVAE